MQIVISNRRSPREGPGIVRPRGLNRVKFFFAGLMFAAIGVGVLIFILIVGSVLAAIAWVALILTIVGLILKASFRRITDGDGRRNPSSTE